jgi:hypothetical protein
MESPPSELRRLLFDDFSGTCMPRSVGLLSRWIGPNLLMLSRLSLIHNIFYSSWFRGFALIGSCPTYSFSPMV